jgi:hypothetical protein
MNPKAKIKSKTSFFLGLVLILFSYIPFSYTHLAENCEIQNCYQLSGPVVEMSKSYSKGGSYQDGWILKLQNVDYKIRIVGRFYESLNKELFENYVKTDSIITVYILKPQFDGIFEKMNSSLGFRDAAAIKKGNVDLLDIETLKSNLQGQLILNWIFLSLLFGAGLFTILKSLR